MTSVAPPICTGFKHLTSGKLFDPAHPKDPAVCQAFPKAPGIPWDILLSKADHRKMYAGDHGLQFEPNTPKDAEYADFLFEPVPAS